MEGNTIFDYFSATTIAAYYDETLANKNLEPFLGDELFPSRKKIGLNLSWIKGSKGLAPSLSLSKFDVKSTKLDRIGFEKLSTDMPFFKNDMLIDEELRQELLRAIEADNSMYIDTILRRIFEDVTTLLDAASVLRERMRMQLLSTGTIVMTENGVDYSYDYGLESDQKYTPTTKWDQANSTPIDDIIAMQDVSENKGFEKPRRAVTSRKVMRALMKNEGIKNAIYVMGNGLVNLTEATVRSYLQEQTGLTIAVYDKTYLGKDGKVKKYLPEDLFILIPEGELGNTWFGTTPEEADLMSSATDAEVTIVDTGVAVTTTKTTDPVSVDTKVSQVCLPSFEAANQIVIGDVLTD